LLHHRWINVSSEAEYVSTAVGFSPVTPGNSIITGVAAAAGATGEAAGALGFIDALLGLLTQGSPLGTQTSADSDDNTGAEADSGNMATLGFAVDAAIQRDLPTAPVQLPEDGKKLLADLVAALTAIDDATKAGQPIDPALHKKLSETLDDLAGMLGITLPAPPAIDPVITAAAAGAVAVPAPTTAPDIVLSSGIAMENKALPPGYELPAPAPNDTETGPDLAARFVAAVNDAIDLPSDTPDVEPPATPPTASAPAEGEAIDPDSQLGQLIAKLSDIAEKLKDRAPTARDKLDAIVAKLTSRALDTETIAKLESDLETAGLDTLLAPRPEGKPKTTKTSPSPFTATTLAMPAIVAQPPKQTTPAPKVAEPPAPAEPELAAPGEVKVAKDTQPAADKPQAEPAQRDRGSFAAHLSEARGEKLAEQANQTQQAQTPTTQVKTDLGIVAPKTVHAAYQTPVQQINVPQVAFEVVRQFNQGASRFQIRLDPPELGRIDVRMQVDGDGNVHARMTVERAETLDLMQRDQRSLEKALAQAGLDSSKTSLEFSLRQSPFGRDGQGQQQLGRDGAPFASRGDRGASQEVPDVPIITQYRGMASASGVNLFV
jgi:flagellar hook-length control protein FliK